MKYGDDPPATPPRKRVPTPNYLLAVTPYANRFYEINTHASQGITVACAEAPATEPQDFVHGERAKDQLEHDAVEYGLEHIDRSESPWCVENHFFSVGRTW